MAVGWEAAGSHGLIWQRDLRLELLKLKLVTAYPKPRATMNDTSLRTIAPAGTPIVLHLYTG